MTPFQNIRILINEAQGVNEFHQHGSSRWEKKNESEAGRMQTAWPWQKNPKEREYFKNLKCWKEVGQVLSRTWQWGGLCVLTVRTVSMDFHSQEPVWEVNWSWDSVRNILSQSMTGKGKKNWVVIRGNSKRLQFWNSMLSLTQAWFIEFWRFLFI